MKPLSFTALLTFSLLLMIMTLTLLFYNEKRDYRKIIADYKINYARIAFPKEVWEESIDVGKIEDKYGINLSFIFYGEATLKSKEGSLELGVPRLQVDDELVGNKIILTDYLYEKLFPEGGDTVYLDGQELKIERIIETNHRDYGEADRESPVYRELLSEEYYNVLIGFDVFLNHAAGRSYSINLATERSSYSLDIRHADHYEDADLGAGEIILPQRFASWARIEVNTQPQLKLEGNVSQFLFPEDYQLPPLTVKGFSEDDAMYLNYYENRDLVKNLFFHRKIALYELDEAFYDLKEDYYVFNFAIDNNGISRFLLKSRTVLLVLSLLGILFVSLVCANYYGHVINGQKKNIFILISLGYEKKKVLRAMLFGLALLMGLSFIIASTLTILFSSKVNARNPLLFKPYWFQFRIYHLLLLLLYLGAIFYLATLLIFKRNREWSLAESIKRA